MIVREVTVGELSDFVYSGEYAQLNPKPISPTRAFSQARNPSGRTDDVALIYIAENEKLLAFAGLLPDELADDPNRIYSNSGWWVHPDFGGKYALPVFLKAFQSCNHRMVLTDGTNYTRSIIEKTGLFEFKKTVAGRRIILKSYLGAYFRRKSGSKIVAAFFFVIDYIVNCLISYRISKWKKSSLPAGYTLRFEDKIDSELNEFIKEHSANYFLKQDGNKLNWIVQNKWITTGKNQNNLPYPFSQFSDSFTQKFMIVYKSDAIVALIFLSERDGHFSLPYIYYDNKNPTDVAVLLVDYLFNMKAKSVAVFHPEVLNLLDHINIPKLKYIRVYRHFGYSKELIPAFAAEKYFQDGEGDVAFT